MTFAALLRRDLALLLGGSSNNLWQSAVLQLLGILLIAVRGASKVGCNLVAARLSGITERKGLLTGLALMPMSAFAILLLEQSRLYGFAPAVQVLSIMAGMMLLQELLGPVVTQRALMAAHETHVTKE